MNLYVIKVRHYSQKDYQEALETYLIAHDDEEVYEWLKQTDLYGMYDSWAEKEEDGELFDIYDDDVNIIGTETFKEKMIRIGGEMYDNDFNPTDLYYGVTVYGWKLIKENISLKEIDILINLGIAKEGYKICQKQ